MGKDSPSHALGLRLRQDEFALTESVQLGGGGKIFGIGQAQRIDTVATQRLTRLGAVDQNGLHTEEHHGLVRDLFGLLIGIDQRGEHILRLLLHTRRHDILQAVENLHLDRHIVVVQQLSPTHPSETVGRRPLVQESQPEVEVLLHKKELVARNRLGYAAVDTVQAHVAVGERLPEDKTPPLPTQRGGGFGIEQDPDEGFGAGVVGVLRDFIVGVVREKYLLGVAAAASQPTRGGDIHPQIGITRQRDKERMHLIVVLYHIVFLAVERQVLTRHLVGFDCIHCV